jgi:hypothetical protein
MSHAPLSPRYNLGQYKQVQVQYTVHMTHCTFWAHAGLELPGWSSMLLDEVSGAGSKTSTPFLYTCTPLPWQLLQNFCTGGRGRDAHASMDVYIPVAHASCRGCRIFKWPVQLVLARSRPASQTVPMLGHLWTSAVFGMVCAGTVPHAMATRMCTRDMAMAKPHVSVPHVHALGVCIRHISFLCPCMRFTSRRLWLYSSTWNPAP